MTFTSFIFIILFPLIVIIFNIIPKKIRLIYLLAVSYIIYGYLQPTYLLLLITTSIVTYLFGIWIEKENDDIRKKYVTISGVILILSPLFLFKYYNFVGDIITSFLQSLNIYIYISPIKWLTPLGISYYTFMSIGYLVDLYNEDIRAEKNPVSVGLFLSFFPIVFSGPIERAGNMFPQINELKGSKLSDLTSGAKLMLWGYFMKLCVADRLAIYINAIYSNINMHNGNSLLAASLLFPIQEYGDLGGYSLIAIGTARCLGINIIDNFKRPFFAMSISSFWRRWHISLIKWLTDYVYTPVSYSLRNWKMWGVISALMLTFLVSGIWHGALMTCVVWGCMQGCLLSIEAITHGHRTALESKYRLQNKWWYTFFCILTVYVLFAFTEIYGMSTSFSEANQIIVKIFSERGSLFTDYNTLIMGLMSVLVLFIKDLRDEYFPNRFLFFESKNIVIRFSSYLFVIFYILLFAVFDGGQFIYFQF